MSTGFHDCRRKVSEIMAIQSLHFQLYSSPVQFGEVAFSVHCFTAPYCPIWIQFGEFHLVPCAFDYTNDDDDDWVKLTPPFGIKLNLDDFEPLTAILFCQST